MTRTTILLFGILVVLSSTAPHAEEEKRLDIDFNNRETEIIIHNLYGSALKVFKCNESPQVLIFGASDAHGIIKDKSLSLNEINDCRSILKSYIKMLGLYHDKAARQ